ncbi:porin [uncultured Succinivibrio sp.]|uniref:porin n=1 Tax=uncultured Succinivibrio sp. TaxID=540749 RepID=UPI0025D0046D|nr:porin [uncultured Succinivibrio sp.]
MKKSLLALAVVAVAASANAATVYDKDGTSLVIDGRIQSVFYNGNHAKAGEHDSSIQNSARFGLGGKTQITDWVAGIGYAQWDMDDKGNGNGTKARDQYVGADFGEFGLLKSGRYVDSSYYAEAVTDHYEDAAGTVQGKFNGERRGGQITYIYDNYGFHGELGGQTAQDNAAMVSAPNLGLDKGADAWAIDSGFNGALGYTFDDVVFGPLSLRAGYSYVKGQSDRDVTGTNGDAFNNFKHAAFGVSWGNLDSGFYTAALYEYAKLSLGEESVAPTYDNAKNKGFELLFGYAFDNGVSARIGYEASYVKASKLNGDETKYQVRRVPVFVNYQINPNFNVWGEVGFNAGSDHKHDFEEKGIANNYAKKLDRTVVGIGARYTF